MKKVILAIALIGLIASCKKTENTAPSGSSGTGGTNCSSVQCSGTTQSGGRCQRTTTNCNGRCWQH